MNLLKALAVIFLSCVFSTFVLAQSDVVEPEDIALETPNQAIKVDEFGREGECQFSGRVDNFLAQLQNNPSATGYVIIYRGKSALPSEYDESNAQKRFAKYVRFRNFDVAQFVFIDGGFRESESNELWLVAAGAAPPVPTGAIVAPELPKDKSFIYDQKYLVDESGEAVLKEFVLPSVVAREEEEVRLAEEEYWRENPDVEVNEPTVEETPENAEPAEAAPTPEELDEFRFFWISEKFGEFLQTQENSRGVIIFYADNERYDIAKLQNFIEQGRDRIAGKAEIPADKISVIFGGYRIHARAEFYVVPENAELPTAAPEEREVEKDETAENSEVRK